MNAPNDSINKELAVDSEKQYGESPAHGTDVEIADAGIIHKGNPLARELKGRHMQMIAIGTT